MRVAIKGLFYAVVLGSFLNAWFCIAATYAMAGDPLAPAGSFHQAPAPAAGSFSEKLHGVQIADPDRQLESLDANVLRWINSQGTYTRSVLDAIAPRKELHRKIADFGTAFADIKEYQHRANREFFEERAPGSDDFNLMVRDERGTRKLIDIGALRALHGGKAYAISYYLASPDGAKVAVGISEGGTENANLTVIDAMSGKTIAGPIDRAQFGLQTWNGDGKILYFNRLRRMRPGDPATDKYGGSTVDAWDMASAPRPILGRGIPDSPVFEDAETPQLTVAAHAASAIAQSTNGAQPELSLWSTDARNLNSRKIGWRQIARREDGITAFAISGQDIYFLSHKDAPNFKVIAMKANGSLAQARTLLPADNEAVIESLHAAADGLYVAMRKGVYSQLLRISPSDRQPKIIALPFKGYISEVFTDTEKPGAAFVIEGWTHPPAQFSYDPKSNRIVDLKLAPAALAGSNLFSVTDATATARDRTQVPLTVIRRKDARGTGVTVLSVYGSYGISFTPAYSRMLVMVQMGGNWAVCHVRGGGELGERWRLAGKDAKKPNTWHDLIDCAEDLVARGITTKEKLFLWGGSAGGIAVGRAMTERPDLFAGVIDDVPPANMLRLEFTPDGPLETAEFGSIRTEQGFRDLLEMDTYQHIRKGVNYPAILITMGLNDPRIAPWMPAKLAARMLRSNARNPVLLRVQSDQGHGIDWTKAQGDQYFTDIISFVFWRAGIAGWRPTR